MNTKHAFIIFLASTAQSLISGCSTTTEQLEQKAAATALVSDHAENYQEIYRRIYSVASRCQSGNVSAYASQTVESQLYSELNYGEITMSLINYGVRNYFWRAKIEKTETGSRLTVFAGNTLANQTVMNRVASWANGNTGCSF